MERSPNTVKACSHDLRDWVESLDQQRPAQRPTHPSTPPGDEVRFASASFAHLIMPRPSRESWRFLRSDSTRRSSPTPMTPNQPPCWQRQIAAHGPRGRDHAAVVPAKQTRLHISELLGLDCGEVVLGTDANVREGQGSQTAFRPDDRPGPSSKCGLTSEAATDPIRSSSSTLATAMRTSCVAGACSIAAPTTVPVFSKLTSFR